MAKVGRCQDPICEYGPGVLGDERDPLPVLRRYEGVWRCEGCVEGIQEEAQWYAANAPDFDWL